MKKIISVLLVVAILCIGLAACGDKTEAAPADVTYISMRINPEIEMIANEDGQVVYASAVNDDGEVVLSAVELEGLSIEEAGAEFTETAAALGYVSEDDATVYVDVQGDSAEETEKIRAALEKNITDYFNNKGINGKVSRETLDKYAGNAKDWGLSTGHTKLAMRVLDAHPELTEEEVLSMEVSQWMTLLNGNKGNSTEMKTLKESHQARLAQIREQYSELFEIREEIYALKTQLENEDLTKAERESIEEEIDSCETEAKELHAEYKRAISEARKSYKIELKELKTTEKNQSKQKSDK